MLLTYTRTLHFSVTASPSCSFFLSRCSVQFPTKWSLVGLVVAEHYFALLSARFRWISSNLGARRSFFDNRSRDAALCTHVENVERNVWTLPAVSFRLFRSLVASNSFFPAVCFRWRLSVVAKHTRALLGDRTNLTDDLLASCWLLLLLITYAWRASSEPVNYYTSWVGKTVPRLFSQ